MMKLGAVAVVGVLTVLTAAVAVEGVALVAEHRAIHALNTRAAIPGPPGPPGEAGLPGVQGPRGFPGADGLSYEPAPSPTEDTAQKYQNLLGALVGPNVPSATPPAPFSAPLSERCNTLAEDTYPGFGVSVQRSTLYEDCLSGRLP